MKLPGQAWLEFKIINTLYQATFKPREFGENYTGTLYYLSWIHFFMLNKLIKLVFDNKHPLTHYPLKNVCTTFYQCFIF
jgi:hypothetical protein